MTNFSSASVSLAGIVVFDGPGRTLATLPLICRVGARVWTVSELTRTAKGWSGLTNDPAVAVEIEEIESGRALRVEWRAPAERGSDVSYFVGASIAASHSHAFIPDDHMGAFSLAQDRTFTITNQAAMRQRLGLSEYLWMLAPQPHVVGFGDATAPAFALSIPECLPSDAVQVRLEKRSMRLDFLHHVADCDGGRLPRVYVDFGLSSRAEALERHLGHARAVGLVAEHKPQAAWWHNPLYCTWGDQCRLGLHGVHKDASLTRERILGWAEKIRAFYDGEVNFIIDDGYFVGMGDFRLRPELYASTAEFRDLIAELKRRRFRVILWYTPFWVDKHAESVTAHPEWILRRRDGLLLDETGDWKGKYHYDWSHPRLREHQSALIQHFLTELDADGFKIDMTYAHPPTRDILPHDQSWAAGNLYVKRVVEFIHAKATALKPDAFLTVNGVECYLQPYTSAVRLNDLFNTTDATDWYERADLVARLMPGVAIDVDGWPGALCKLREYPFVASVYGAPVSYYLDGTEIGDAPFGEAEINRLASVWATYAHAPMHADDRVIVEAEHTRFERRGADGGLRALSLARRVFVAYGDDTIRVTASDDIAVAVPLEDGRTVATKAVRVGRDGSRVAVPLHVEDGRVLFFAEDAGKGVLYYELS